jgi:hypothetical protein
LVDDETAKAGSLAHFAIKEVIFVVNEAERKISPAGLSHKAEVHQPWYKERFPKTQIAQGKEVT